MATAASPIAFEGVVNRGDEFVGAPGVIRFVELPPRRAVMIDGHGPPGPEAFAPRLPGLYATAYGLRFALKARGLNTNVGPLEGLWWTATEARELDTLLAGRREDWRWTLLIALPDEATDAEIETALAAGRGRLTRALAANLRVETFREGRAAQVLHLGSYADERPTIEQLHAAVGAAGLRLRGRHHEIYLGDPRRSAPERLRTIIRHPVD